MADTGPGYERMKNIRNETGHDIRPGNFGSEGLLVLEIEAEGSRPGVAAGKSGRLMRFDIANTDADIRTVEEIPDEGSGDKTGSEDEYGFNGKPPCPERNRGISADRDSLGSVGRDGGSWLS